jgi:hypothetical protein
VIRSAGASPAKFAIVDNRAGNLASVPYICPPLADVGISALDEEKVCDRYR